MKVDINLQKVDIDQCSSDGWFSGTHKCHLNNSEVNITKAQMKIQDFEGLRVSLSKREDKYLRLAIISFQALCVLLDCVSMLVLYRFRKAKINFPIISSAISINEETLLYDFVVSHGSHMRAEFLFLLWGVYLCYAVRTVPSAFHEPRYMAVAVHNELIISAIFHTIRQFSHSSNNPRDDIATEAYEDELDMGRSGSYLNSSINSAWSEHSLDPEDIRDELKKLYAQLEIYKRKKMITNNPHLQKKRCSKKGLGRSIMRRITEIPETVSRQCSKEDKDALDHGVAKGAVPGRRNPQEAAGGAGKPKEESLRNRVFSLKKSHSTYEHVREQPGSPGSPPAPSREEEAAATDDSALGSPAGTNRPRALQDDSQAVSTESVPLVCKSASAHNLSSEKKPGPPRTSVLQKSLSVIASAKEKTLGLAGKTQASGVEERAKAQKALTREKETNRKYSNSDNTETQDSAPSNSNHSKEPRKPPKSGIMRQQRANPPTASSDLSPGAPQMKDSFDIGEVCPWEIYDLTPGPVPSESKVQKHVSIAASEMEKTPSFSLKGKSHPKPKAAELCQQSNPKSIDKAEVCPWESQVQPLFEDEKCVISKTQVPPGRAQGENGGQHSAASVCAGQCEEVPPKAVASEVENENLNQLGDQEKKTSSSEQNVPDSYNSSNNFQQPLTSRAEVCPWEFETPDQPNAERRVAFPASSALSANKIAGPRK
ncbi:hypothetical protein EI555_015475 [Monodon monoceros]|uniref:Uncharacterized protein n=1 Tax=Monodon monoceros TaxID=40151 RepID=A0A4U1ERQ5_MONMO|nr:hypothetical protein EI555_015475 [Monodon monoceros]